MCIALLIRNIALGVLHLYITALLRLVTQAETSFCTKQRDNVVKRSSH